MGGKNRRNDQCASRLREKIYLKIVWVCSEKKLLLSAAHLIEEGVRVKENIGERLVSAVKEPQKSESHESLIKAMELTKAYASSGSITHYSAVARTFYELFEMFETGKDPRQK